MYDSIVHVIRTFPQNFWAGHQKKCRHILSKYWDDGTRSFLLSNRLICWIWYAVVLLGDPENISNAIKQGKNSLKWTEFHVDFINGLHSEVRGRAPGRKAVFHISLPINRYNFFKALISNFISTFYDFYFMFLYPFFVTILLNSRSFGMI